MKRSGTETNDGKPDGSWNRTAGKMVQNCEGSGHPIFRCARPLERGRLREGNSGETDDSESEPWYEKPAPQNNEACVNHLQEDQQNSCLPNSRKVKAIEERLRNTSLPYRHTTFLT